MVIQLVKEVSKADFWQEVNTRAKKSQCIQGSFSLTLIAPDFNNNSNYNTTVCPDDDWQKKKNKKKLNKKNATCLKKYQVNGTEVFFFFFRQSVRLIINNK